MNNNLYKPSKDEIKATLAWDFIQKINKHYDLNLQNWNDLYKFSINKSEDFWSYFFDYAKIIADGSKTPVLTDKNDFINSKWFDKIKLNFAQNLLLKNDNTEAIVFWAEDKIKQKITHKELRSKVVKLASYLKEQGVKKGDRVAGFLPNMIETVISMLATTSLGAVWSSCSPDFGVKGVADRFAQIKPKVFICVDGYYYNCKTFSCIDKNQKIIQKLKPSSSILVRFTNKNSSINGADNFDEIIKNNENKQLKFTKVGFNDPLYIMFSSGTTGKPKCITHGVGGTLIQHKKEHLLHSDIKKNNRVFYFTTCGWMMWNWLVSSLASDTVLMLYDGSPFLSHNDNILFDYAQKEKINIMGVSAKYIDTMRKKNMSPIVTHNLDSLILMLSTGSVLSGTSFDFIYQKIKKNMSLASISGGTDIVSCFALGSKMLNVRRAQLQTRGLGMAVEVWNEAAEPITNKKGELVCIKTFPSKPIGFWGDENNKKYKNAYFSKYPNIWFHGDFVELKDNGAMIFYGRSDTTLNPGGVRIGTAEIYRQVEKLDEVLESVVVGQNFDNDVRVILFVKLQNKMILDDDLTKKIKTQIRNNTTPRHVPAKIFKVDDIPRTKSGKISEVVVQKAIHNLPIDNTTALANPESVKQYLVYFE